MKTITASHLLLILFMAVAWGGNSTAMRIIVEGGMGPLTAAALRFSISLGITYLFTARQKIPLVPTRREAVLCVPFILFGLIQIGLFNTAARYTTASRVGLLVNAYPLWVMLVSGFIFHRDRMTLVKLAGAVMAMGGVAVVFQDGLAGGGLTGDAMSLVSSLFLTALILHQKWLLEKGLHPMRILTLQMTGFVPSFFLVAGLTEGTGGYVFSTPIVLGLLYQGVVVGGAAFIIFQYMQRIYLPSQIASFFFLIPVFSVASGVLLLSEALTPSLGIGLVLVATGIRIINRRLPEDPTAEICPKGP